MVLPTMQMIMTLFLAHVFILAILLFCWFFIRYAQKKHHEKMTHGRIKEMPKAKHPDLKDQILEKQREPVVVLETRPKIVKKKITKDTTKSYEKEWAEVEEELKVLRGDVAPDFSHKGPSPSGISKEDKITAEQIQLTETLESSESQNKEEFEKHLGWVKEAIERKGYRDPGLKSYEEQLNSIDETLASLDIADTPKEATIVPESERKSVRKSHQDWRESVQKDFENLYRMTSQQAKKHSWFRKKPEHPFVAMHEEEVEKKAIDLVRKIARRIEGDHPIPTSELDWLEAGLMDVHRDIWKKEKD